MTYNDIVQRVSEDTGISVDIVDKAYKAFWLYIRNSVQELPLKDSLTETEFLSLKTNFNIPSLGKLSCTFDRYKGVKERLNYIKSLRKRNEEVN